MKKILLVLLLISFSLESAFAWISDSIKTYTIQRWDNYWKIEKKLKVQDRHVLAKLNNYESLYVGKTILVSYYDWKIINIVNPKIQTVENLAYYYKVEKKDIISANINLINKDHNSFDKWDIIFIPHAYTYKEYWTWLKSIKNEFKLSYNEDTKRQFPKWQCTWFVSKYKYVNWWWNAKDWIVNAKNAWAEIGNTAKKWSIIVFKASRDYPVYWHVWIVYDIIPRTNKIIISEMNYKGEGIISYRLIDMNDKNIKGYIYDSNKKEEKIQ